ncbi:MAG: hypothetical protein XD65_1200, partial [Caldanaerobacter subterraneus]
RRMCKYDENNLFTLIHICVLNTFLNDTHRNGLINLVIEGGKAAIL